MPSLLHISDIHFGPPHRPPVAEGLVRVVQERSPELVVVSGDMTQRAKRYQFQQARRWIDGLSAPAIAVPGNHDVPMYRFWERTFAPFGVYRRYFDRELEPTLETKSFFVVGLNTSFNWTQKHGRLLPFQIESAVKRLESAPAGKRKIAVMHHPLMKVPGFAKEPVTKRSERALVELSRCGVELVLSGHLHQLHHADARDTLPALGRSMYLLQSGTSSSNRGRGLELGKCSCWWIDFLESSIRFEGLMWSDQTQRFETCQTHERSAALPHAQ